MQPAAALGFAAQLSHSPRFGLPLRAVHVIPTQRHETGMCLVFQRAGKGLSCVGENFRLETR